MSCENNAPVPQRFRAKIATKGCGDLAINSVVGLENTGAPLPSIDCAGGTPCCTWILMIQDVLQ
ncbi:MAG: hypothetical protein CM15mV51_0500 [uncultured marine virus]|nr:MAG: hypothetical protein CM15mV51_0500 [uncultured marine virus]